MSEPGEGGGEKEKKPKPALVRLNSKTNSGGGGFSSPLSTSGNKLGARALGVTPLNRSSSGSGGASLFSSPNRTSGLQSFKPKRDLTLGSAGVKGLTGGSPAAIAPLKSVTSATPAAAKPLERKKFVPNLNVTRQIKKENNGDAAATNGGSGKRRRDNNKSERREKNNRDRPTLIQTDSIFSEGNFYYCTVAHNKIWIYCSSR